MCSSTPRPQIEGTAAAAEDEDWPGMRCHPPATQCTVEQPAEPVGAQKKGERRGGVGEGGFPAVPKTPFRSDFIKASMAARDTAPGKFACGMVARKFRSLPGPFRSPKKPNPSLDDGGGMMAVGRWRRDDGD